ncbi:MAG: low temperature requirement protein A [Acidimicrobiales bacterium]
MVAAHPLRPMRGRDPHEQHRVATPLELLFDLAFTVAFGAAGNELAHAVAAGHTRAGLASFAFCLFGICWAWINYAWFASAFDTDDWLFRVLTMVQMAGVIVLAMGIPDVFASITEGDHLDNRVVVAGYIVMRVAMVGLWIRVYRHDPARRAAARSYIVSILVAQVLWTVLGVVELGVGTTFALLTVPLAIELSGPMVAERRYGGTPWHAHHIAERYGLLAIITIGEAVIGTVSAMSALVHDDAIGWSAEAVAVLAGGVLLTFGMWWVYFVIPWGEVLHHHRERSFGWGYGHIVVFGGIAATGAGLHVVQYLLDGESEQDTFGTLLAVVVPVTVFLLAIYVMYSVAMRTLDRFHVTLIVLTLAVLGAGLALAAADVSIAVCLAVVALAPVVAVVGYETVGHRHAADHLARLRAG